MLQQAKCHLEHCRNPVQQDKIWAIDAPKK